MSVLDVPAGTVQNTAEQSEPQWLINGLNRFKTKHKPSYDVLTRFTRNDSPPTMRQLLEVGFSRETELVDRHNRNVENLVHHQDLDKRLIWIEKKNNWYLVFKPYLKAAKIVRKFVKDEIDIPEYDGTGTPEDHGQACYDRINTVAGNRLEFVRQYLSDFHIHYAAKNISAKRTKVRRDQITEAKLQRADSRQAGTRDVANLPSVPPEPVVAHATTRPFSSPIEAPLSKRVSFDHSDRTPVSGFRAVRREGLSVSPLTPHVRKRFRVDSEQVPAEIVLPASNSNTTDIHHHVFSLEIEPRPNVPMRPNPINAVTVGTQPTLPIDNSLLQSAMEKVAEECGEQLDSLMKRTACGPSASLLDRAIRACNFGLKNGPPCAAYQRIVATLKKWVLQSGDEEQAPACIMKEIDAEIRNRIFEDRHEVEQQLLELYISNTVDQKMTDIKRRRSAVFSLMTVDDQDALDVGISQRREQLKVVMLKYILYGHIRSIREKENPARHSSPHQTPSPTSQMHDFLSREQP